MITRRQALSSTLLSGAAPFLSRAAGRKLNVLLIAVDDLNNRLGCYGDPVVKSPNIDALARRGVRFDNAYCNYPVCNASRTSLLSGLRPETTQVLGNTTPPRTTIGDVAFLPEHFRANGYFTARVGKIAHGAYEDAVKWDISESSAGRRDTIRGKGGRDRKKAATDGGLALWWTPTNNDDSEEPDGRTARRIGQIITENRDKPFFLGCGFHKPHLPWVAPKKYFDLYPPDRIELPNTPANDRDDIPPIALTHQPADDNLTGADRRQAIAAYHAATSFMDAQVGYVLRQLDTLKLWDNTVVLLFGDHGWHLNEHLGLWRKMSLFEESSRAPLIVAAPGIKPAATRALTEFVDIYPSLAELAGLKPPAHALEGTSFTPVLREPARRWKKAAFTVVSRGRRTLGHTIRTERYRYTEWDSPGVNELYDHQADPKEFTNLARDPKNAPLVAQMRKALNDGWRAALP